MLSKLLLLILGGIVTAVLWFALEKTHPVFVAEEAITAGRQAGGLTEEWINDIRREDLKSAIFTFSMWGGVLGGYCGLLGNSRGKRRLLGLALGLFLGIFAGAVSAYVGQWHDLSTEYSGPTTTYWLTRWGILCAPLAIAASMAAAVSGDFLKDLADSLAGGLIGAVIGVSAISLLMGVVTPVESHQYIYPSFPTSRLLALMSVNLGVVAMIIWQLGRKSASQSSVTPSDSGAVSSV